MDKARLSKQAKLAKNVQYEAPITLYGTAIVKKDCIIGAYTFINSNTTVYPSTNIGRYCSVGKNCEIAAFDHPIDWLSTSPFQYNMKLHFPKHEGECHQLEVNRPKQTIVGNDVWIGSLSIIKRGVTIGDGAIVAGGAVVIHDVPPYAIVGGVPAKILKYRFNEKTIEKLLALRWWEYSPKELDGVQFDDIDKALQQIELLKNKDDTVLKEKSIEALQNMIDERMERSEVSEAKMSIEILHGIISSQLLEVDIEEEVIEDILMKNKNMNRDYDEDEHEDSVILNHKIAAVIEIVLADTMYVENKQLSPKAHKKISNVLRLKH